MMTSAIENRTCIWNKIRKLEQSIWMRMVEKPCWSWVGGRSSDLLLFLRSRSRSSRRHIQVSFVIFRIEFIDHVVDGEREILLLLPRIVSGIVSLPPDEIFPPLCRLSPVYDLVNGIGLTRDSFLLRELHRRMTAAKLAFLNVSSTDLRTHKSNKIAKIFYSRNRLNIYSVIQ